MKCANPACINEFERVGRGCWNKKFCSPSCATAVYRHSENAKDAWGRAYAKRQEQHPDMKIPRSHPAYPETLTNRARIVEALQSGPKFRMELMKELGITSKQTMNTCLHSLVDHGKIVSRGTAFQCGRTDVESRSVLYGLPVKNEPEPVSGEFARAKYREPRAWRELHRDPFEAMNLAMLARR